MDADRDAVDTRVLTLEARTYKRRLYIILEFLVTEAVLDIKKWGNSLGVRLPTAVARAAHLHADQRVRVVVKNGQVMIIALTDAPLSLEQRLALFDVARHGGEAMASAAVGVERP